MDTDKDSAPETESTEKDIETVEIESEEPKAGEEIKPESEKSSIETDASTKGEGKFKQFWHKYKANKKLSIPLTILALIVIILAIPMTRYQFLGLFMKQQFSIKVLDASTNDPVAAATVNLAGVSAQSNAEGQATVKVKVGQSKLTITKKYYADYSQNVTVPVTKGHSFEAKIVATGRLVPVAVVNKITGVGVENVTVKAADTQTKTSKDGNAIIVLPSDKTSVDATLSGNGYNDLKVTITVLLQTDPKNTFSITPTGKIYFLSKASGKIDVVKTNLDGSDRQIVLAGTGKEDDADTILLASRDWKYLALKSRRDSTLAKLYEINTADDKLTTMDEGDASFDMIGWQDNYFNYYVYRNNVKNWQPKAASLKSYNAQFGKIMTLDNTNASGSSNETAQYETFNLANTHLFNGQIVYTKTWYSYPGYLNVPGHQDTLNSISPDGSNKKIISSVDAGTSYFGSVLQYEPAELLIQVSPSGDGTSTFYTYDIKAVYKKDSSITNEATTKTYPTYLLSPSGSQIFWSEERDGKNSLFTSSSDGSNKNTIGSLTEYNTYGWYSDSYLLVSKKSSELYIMANGPLGDKAPLKISDYHKADQSFYGYGGGYGGI